MDCFWLSYYTYFVCSSCENSIMLDIELHNFKGGPLPVTWCSHSTSTLWNIYLMTPELRKSMKYWFEEVKIEKSPILLNQPFFAVYNEIENQTKNIGRYTQTYQSSQSRFGRAWSFLTHAINSFQLKMTTLWVFLTTITTPSSSIKMWQIKCITR